VPMRFIAISATTLREERERCGRRKRTRSRVICGKPRGVKIKEADDENGEEQGAVDARAIEDVGCRYEEEQVDRGSIGAVRQASGFSKFPCQ
jgi:hypothetical protein